jgi:adenine-specific DNA-methyltransferase
MYPRLTLLRKLLKNDGVIFISIDDNEQANLKLLCDEIFGAGNFVNTIHWRRTESQNNNAKHLSTVGEYILCYTKTDKNNNPFNKIELSETAVKEYRYEDEKGKFRRGTIVDNSRGKHLLNIIAPNGIEKTIKSIRTREFFDENDKNGMIYWTDTGTPYLKLYLDKSDGQISNNWFDKEGVNEDAAEELSKYNLDFQFSKPHTLIQKLISLVCNKTDIILDSFAGSGTTAHAVLNLNKADGGERKFILIECQDYAETITAERIRRVLGSEKSTEKATIDFAKTENIGFSFYKLGEPLLIDEQLNNACELEDIRKYIWHTEIGDSNKQNLEGLQNNLSYFLGSFNETDIYFYYEKDKATYLDYDFLATISQKAEHYLIYADVCYLSKEFMEANHIRFKKIPRDITRI